MEKPLINLKDRLKNAGFRFEASTSVYNPMERFADYVSRKEIVHSKIIADLLNPKGEHQLGYGFLVIFLQTIGIGVKTKPAPSAGNPLQDVLVETEYFAPTDDLNGRIDILVRFIYGDRRYAIIIENKLNDAPDQHKQLERYNDYVEKKLKYRADERITVYMPRVGDKCDVFPTAKVINATMLAKIIDETLEEFISPNKAALQSYSNYLKNISMSNIIMENAKKLALLSAEDIQEVKAIKEAYDLLPQAFAEMFKEKYTGTACKAEIAAGYSHYCYIWNEDAYNETSLWLAIGFYYNSYRIYVVSNNEEKLKKHENNSTLPIVREQTTQGKIWFRPQNDTDFEIRFNGVPDFEELKKIANKWLKKLDEVAGVK